MRQIVRALYLEKRLDSLVLHIKVEGCRCLRSYAGLRFFGVVGIILFGRKRQSGTFRDVVER